MCIVDGCVESQRAHGMCNRHYQRQIAGKPVMTADDAEAAEFVRIAAADPFYDFPLLGTYRVSDHRCGRCAWDGTGRSDCRNRRPSQTVPYMREQETGDV